MKRLLFHATRHASLIINIFNCAHVKNKNNAFFVQQATRNPNRVATSFPAHLIYTHGSYTHQYTHTCLPPHTTQITLIFSLLSPQFLLDPPSSLLPPPSSDLGEYSSSGKFTIINKQKLIKVQLHSKTIEKIF